MLLLQLSRIFHGKIIRTDNTAPDPRALHRAELQELLLLRQSLQSKFDLETDDDRIEVFIYEMEALDARIRSVLRRARAGAPAFEAELPRKEGQPAAAAV